MGSQRPVPGLSYMMSRVNEASREMNRARRGSVHWRSRCEMKPRATSRSIRSSAHHLIGDRDRVTLDVLCGRRLHEISLRSGFGLRKVLHADANAPRPAPTAPSASLARQCAPCCSCRRPVDEPAVGCCFQVPSLGSGSETQPCKGLRGRSETGLSGKANRRSLNCRVATSVGRNQERDQSKAGYSGF